VTVFLQTQQMLSSENVYDLLLLLKSWSDGLWLGFSYYCGCFGFFLFANCFVCCLLF